MSLIETKIGESPSQDIDMLRSAKVAIVNSYGQILTLRRSQREDSRQGEPDWPGGKFEPGETTILEVLSREVEREELPGTKLNNVRPLSEPVRKITKDGPKVHYLLAATAEFPAEGIVLGGIEHDDYDWVLPEEYNTLNIPKKYRMAVALGRSVLDEMAILAQEQPLQLVTV